jgi:membrane protein implicated in regulation of membrane protease activity
MKATHLGLGGLISALLALSCCGSALLFLLFGVSMASFGFLDLLAPYQGVFQALSILLLILAWGRLYRRRSCVKNSPKTFWMLVGISLLLITVLAIPYMDFS